MKTIAVSITEEQHAWLKSEQLRSGAPVSLQVRRALDAQSQRDQKTNSQAETETAIKTCTAKTPVLVAPRFDQEASA
jgi:hypothetical protein